jgi:hypothetical protein
MKIDEKFAILAEIVRAMKGVYDDPKWSKSARGFAETIVGAGIFYITPKWSGFISKNLLKEFHPDSGIPSPKIVHEHPTPRKISGKTFLRTDWNASNNEELIDNLHQKFEVVNYVTKDENQRLKPFQKEFVFQSPEIAYSRAGIELVSISKAELKQVKLRNKLEIENCLTRTTKNSS